MNIQKISKLSIFTVAAISLLSYSIFAQKLVSSSPNGSMQARLVNNRLTKVFGPDRAEFVSKPIDIRKITYTSVNAKGVRTNLTGAIAMPQDGAPKGLVVFCHGTTQDRKVAPSRFTGNQADSEVETAVLAFATDGYAVVMPDYIGLGDDKGAHPYPMSVVNAKSAIDIIPAARQLARSQKYDIGSNLFMTGYSEGGGIAMSAAKSLQEMSGANYKLTASAPASGPYDLSGVTANFMKQTDTDQLGFGIRLYLFSYSTYFLRKERNIKITDYFKPAMANSIWLNYNANLSDENLIKRLVVSATLMRAKNSIDNVLTDRFKKVLAANDRRDPLVAELYRNNTFDWKPTRPMLLINLDGDTVVDPANTKKAFDTMSLKGVGHDILRRSVIRDTSLTHLNAIPEAMFRARTFFNGGFANMKDLEQ